MNQTSSITLRLAALMDREKIEGLPRNYELVYDAFSGTNPELTREFKALGNGKTQKALDEIGRKYLPHQHEEGVLAKANETIQNQMTSFLQLLQEESSSLAEFEKLIGETSRELNSEKEMDREAIAKSIDKLSKATVEQFRTNQALGSAAAAQNRAISEFKKEMDSLEARKWTDMLTGLANRRAFNKEILSVYSNPDKPSACVLVFAEFDDFASFSTKGDFPFSNQILRKTAGLFMPDKSARHFAAYLERGRFALICKSSDIAQAVRFVEGLRDGLKAQKKPVTRKNGSNAPITFSYGVAPATSAQGPRELTNFCERALLDSAAAGGDKVTVYVPGEKEKSDKAWRIYQDA
jgi:diguanylate cyclase